MSINVNDKNLGHATAYAYYKAGGGTMTEAEFTEFMADFGTASQTAVEAAQAALASKNAAQTAATTATTKASEATTAATTATTKAGEASTSASTATSAKDTAVSASQTATTKATEATTAAATATSAATTATTAKDDAVSAKTAAQTAQTGAETAAASVSASAAQIATNAEDISQLKSDLGTGFFNSVDYDGNVNDLGAGVTRTLPTATNIPFAVVGYVVTFARTASTAKAQLFINAQNGSVAEQSRLFSRFLANGSWTPWIEYTNRTDIWTNSNDYSGDVNNAEFGMMRVSATAAHNPGGTVGFLITYERAASSKMQIFVTNEMLYFRTSSSSVWGEWQSISRWKTDLKTGYTFGDSLMAQDGAVYAYQDPQYNTDEIGHTCVGWQTHLRKNFGVTITNYAVGGQDILHQKDAIMSKDYNNVDFVIISTGMNDYSSSVPMGALPTSKTPVYTSGAFIDTYCQCLDYIFTSNPKVKVLLFTPTQRDTTWRNGGTPDISIYASDIFTPNSQGLYLKDYANAIKQIGEQYGCVVCDLYGQSGFNYMTLPEYTFEGVHPTNKGYKYTMPVVNDAFNKL